MEVCIDTQWYRDEVTGDGALRPITEMSQYAEFGQDMDWDEEEMASTKVKAAHKSTFPQCVRERDVQAEKKKVRERERVGINDNHTRV